MKYRTIVADPPWEYPEGFPTQSRSPGRWEGEVFTKPLPYAAMPFEDICELPIRDLAEKHCRLFLWTTNRYLDDAFEVLRAWRFRYRQALVWHKRDGNLGGSVAPCSAEFLLVATRGAPPRLQKLATAVIATAAPKQHSSKPDAFLDLVEQVSPGPYLELFARRQRLGWDTWGNEALEHVEIEPRPQGLRPTPEELRQVVATNPLMQWRISNAADELEASGAQRKPA